MESLRKYQGIEMRHTKVNMMWCSLQYITPKPNPRTVIKYMSRIYTVMR
jgi:hypothetical protein